MRRGGQRGFEAIKPGGQALLDGVFMRTSSAWAIARADGTVESGELPAAALQSVPVGRVLGGLARALKVGVGRGLLGAPGDAATRRAIRRRLLLALVFGEVAVLAATWLASSAGLSPWFRPVTAVLTIVVALAAVRAVLPAPLWRYHGAEHKAVAAFEAGISLDDVDAVLRCDRVHARCGTNLVFLVAMAGALLEGYPVVVQLPMFVVALGVAAEVVGAAATRPSAWWSRVVVGGGKFLQRRLTTAEPSFAEQAVACRALSAALAEHARLQPAAPTLAA